MNKDIKVKKFDELSTVELYEILKSRFKVFVMEQHCFYLDLDDIDCYAYHIIIDNDECEVIGYARLYLEKVPDIWHVGRVLTTVRGEGYGKLIMEKVIEVAKELNAAALRMDAQCHAIPFYEKLGFSICSEPFEEAGIPHIMMQMFF